jgi:GH24 family phage-related lysozyme (muramidase)
MAELSPSAMVVEFIKAWEGCVLTPYRDAGGRWTCGWGHLMDADEPREKWSQAQADEVFRSDLNVRAAWPVLNRVTVDLAQCQFDALVSFTFNVGGGRLAYSTLLGHLNNGNYSLASAEFPRWKLVNGVENKGLVKRRAAERAMFGANYSGRP